MTLKDRFEHALPELLNDSAICQENRRLFAKFFEFQQYKLKRQNGLPALDDGCYRTLVAYVTRLRTVNRWFQNKPWKRLTKGDIKRVYDDLEDGRIKTLAGAPVRDRTSYYNKIMRAKPFALAGKADLVREVLELSTHRKKEDVRFITEETFRAIVGAMTKPEHRLLAWLCFDVGENATAILKLRKRDCMRRSNPDSKEFEYLINLRRETLKRSRRSRSELTNYRETVEFLDGWLESLNDDAPLFAFGYAQANKILQRAVRITGARCIPGGHRVTLKDLRSSMACDLLSKGWTSDEVNARLGHNPSSRELDRYANFLAYDGKVPKRKLHANQIEKLLRENEEVKQQLRLLAQRREGDRRDLDVLQQAVSHVQQAKQNELRQIVEQIMRESSAKKAA